MATTTTRAAPTIAVWILDVNTRTSHAHARDIRGLGGHRHSIPPVAWDTVGGHAIATPRHRVHDLLLAVHRHGLWVPAVLHGVHVRPVRSAVRVAIATRWDSNRSGTRVLHSRTASMDQRSILTISAPRSRSRPGGIDLEYAGYIPWVCENESLGGSGLDGVNAGRCVEGHGKDEGGR